MNAFTKVQSPITCMCNLNCPTISLLKLCSQVLPCSLDAVLDGVTLFDWCAQQWFEEPAWPRCTAVACGPMMYHSSITANTARYTERRYAAHRATAAPPAKPLTKQAVLITLFTCIFFRCLICPPFPLECTVSWCG